MDDVWAWNGERWRLLPREGEPPPPRSYHRIVHAHGRLLAYGGFHFQFGMGGPEWSFRDDLWTWDGERWAELVPEGEERPAGRSNHSMVYDTRRRVVLAIGGMCGPAEPCEANWQWDGRQWLRLSGAAPSSRRLHAMGHDEARGATVLFGGLDQDAQVLGDTWERRSPSWIELQPDQPPVHGQATRSAWAVRTVRGGSGSSCSAAAPTSNETAPRTCPAGTRSPTSGPGTARPGSCSMTARVDRTRAGSTAWRAT